MTTPITRTSVRAAAGLMIALTATIAYPETGLAAQVSEGNQSLVFELKPNALKDNSSGLSIDEVAAQDAVVTAVQNYLEAKKSPLAPYAAKIVQLPQWQHALGITFVESNFCGTANSFNCGSLGVGPSSPYWQRFQSPYDGFAALTTLLEKPLYKARLNTCAKKKGVYVVPGSSRWVRGCEKVETELKALVSSAETAHKEKLAIYAQSTITKEIAFAN